ncbi:hypothetical protein [uncultured Dysosmobacter sp.]|uniref:hypothetical protein n=1 Tax=uncultured Dysosmobacter sp. TaxID=2591384 RepID=UPI002601CEFE|nr:hypothetical protein [uncultured Dysosmobacter sp.]
MENARYISPREEGQEADVICIDTSLIPDSVRDGLAAATLDLIHDILRQPGGREAMDAKIAARKAAAAAR